eukprot:6188595-Pleurochrysis_carterae.AAC.3
MEASEIAHDAGQAISECPEFIPARPRAATASRHRFFKYFLLYSYWYVALSLIIARCASRRR